MHPVFLKMGDFVIYWYGVFVALGVVVASLLFQRKATKLEYSEKDTGTIIFYAVIFGILGARIIHIFSYLNYYMRNVMEIFMIRNGGLAVHGGILFGMIGLLLAIKKTGKDIGKTFDIVALYVPLGQAIGRIGCFFHGCCYGKPSDGFFSVRFPFLEHPVHPTQLYYFAGDLAIFFILLLFSKDKQNDGEIAAWYLMFFGALRYWIDQFRGDLIVGSTGFYPTQIYAIICFLIGALWIFRIFFRQKII